MKKVINLIAVAIVLLFFDCTPSEVFFEDALCIQNISTIDPMDGLKENQTVIIKNGKIFKIAPSNGLKLSLRNNIIDGSGKYLMPGLWDSHVHFNYIEALAPSMFDLFLAYGITGVRDTGGRIDFVKKWKDLSLANPTDVPRVMIAGPLMDGIPTVYDGSDQGHPLLSVSLKTVEDVVRQVNFLDSIGVDFLKAYEMLTPEQFIMVGQLGKEKGLKVTGHVPLSMDVISASNAGMSSMEHLRNLEMSCASNADDLLNQRRKMLVSGRGDQGSILRAQIHHAQRKTAIDNYSDEKAEEVIRVLAENQTWQIPTLTLYSLFITRRYTQPHWQESFDYLPDSIGQQWKKIIDARKDDEVSAFSKQYSSWLMKMVGKIHQAGIGIMAGTDSPIGYLTPGLSLHEELVFLVKSGLSPLDAIRVATLNPAKYFNLENEIGSIKENMWADLLILNANPLENINNTKSINAVVKQGKLFDRNKLDQILKRISEK